MPYITIIGALAMILIMWVVFTRRLLAMLEDNLKNAMSQIGVLLTSRWETLSALLEVIKNYAEQEYKTLSDAIMTRRFITGESAAREASEQEKLLAGTMGRVIEIAEQAPLIKADQGYRKMLECVNRYEGMVLQSRLIYNDSVTKFNRQIRTFPTSLVAEALGFAQRDYLEAGETAADRQF